MPCNSRQNRGTHSTTNYRNSFFKLRHFLTPRTMIILALLFCWNLRNSFAVALYNPDSSSGIIAGDTSTQNRIPYYPHSPYHNHHRTITSNVRLRAPPSLNQYPSSQTISSTLPLRGTGISLSDETAIVGPLMIRSPPKIPSASLQSSALAPLDFEITAPRRKKGCGEPSIATRGLLGPTLKRSFFAYTQDEVDQKVRDDEYRAASERRKRDIQHQQLSQQLSSVGGSDSVLGRQIKRNGASGGGAADIQDSPLPWTCETQYEWEDMGADHYPRFVRTAKCKSRLCFNGFFRCRPRRYKTKVLKRINPGDSTSCEDDDVSLPETLRSQWKFITVTINLCCDCTGRIPGSGSPAE